MYQALYRSYRPETFAALLGQEHIVKILANQLKTQTTGHAYLFCGTRGTGKTSTARLLAKGMNCLSPQGQRPCGECAACRDIAAGTFVDVLEIDAASNNGVDNIRELRESVNFPPAVGRTKVYIIDEAHMLSNSAANALLKTLEEPPSDILFILATTEPQKIPSTIISRCMRLDFRRVSEIKMKERFAEICTEMGIDVQEDALHLIASNADGSLRDGLSILDRCISGFGRVSREDVLAILGIASEEVYVQLTDHIMKEQIGEALLLLNQVLAEGKDVHQFAKDWVEHFRNLMILKFVKEPQNILNISAESITRLHKQSESISLEEINHCIVILSEAIADAKWSPKPRILVELALVQMKNKRSPSALPAVERQTPPPPQAQESGDLKDVWEKILLDKAVSTMLKTSGSVLQETTQTHFIVQVKNSFQEDCFLQERSLFERLMEKETGKKLHMELKVEEAQGSFL